MPLQTFNYLNAPRPNTDTGIQDIFDNYLKGYENAKKPEEIRAKNKIKNAESEHAPAYYKNRAKHKGAEADLAEVLFKLKSEFGERESEADIQDTLASASLKSKQAELGGMSRSGITPGQRALDKMPAAARENMLAQTRAWGYSDIEALMALAGGKTLEDLKESARMSGIDVDNAEPIFAVTTPNITASQKRSVLSAGHEVLDKFLEEGSAKYGKKIFGYAPDQIWDHIKGGKEDDLATFYAARMLEDEGAVMAIAKAGGQVNMHAVDNMINKGMGNTKVIPWQMNEKILRKTKQKAREIMQEVVDAERKSLTQRQSDALKGKVKKTESTPYGGRESPYDGRDAEHTAAQPGAYANQDMVTIRNKQTGETRQVSREEAMKMGAIR